MVIRIFKVMVVELQHQNGQKCNDSAALRCFVITMQRKHSVAVPTVNE